MNAKQVSDGTARNTRRLWIKYALLVLIVEKIIQHVAVTLAFYLDTGDIRATVAVNPDVLMILGGVVAVLFAVSLWGILANRRWAPDLVIGLAVFDLAGEFVAQGTILITIYVSFLVAVILLVLALVYRRDRRRTTG